MKRHLLTNVTTMAMALFLSMLTWVYLFTQGNGPADVDVQFLPRLDMKDFASVRWEDAEGRELIPDRPMVVHVLGPKADVRALRPNDYACEIRLDPKELSGPQGTFNRPLTRQDFNLPRNISIDPLPRITVRYVHYEERTIELTADRTNTEGALPPGYEIESITPSPRHIRARVPADKSNLNRVEIRTVPVEGKTENFILSGWFLSELASDLKIHPQEPFTVEVKIALRPASKRIAADLHVSAKPDALKRIELETRTVTIELRGPENLVEAAAKRPAAFVPYVVVTDADLEPPGPKNIGELGCHILDPAYQGKITVVLMPDAKPENRQAKIKVLPK